MTSVEHIEKLATAEEKADAIERWCEWYIWDSETEWSPEDEKEYNTLVYLGVLLDIELGREEYTDEEIKDYRISANDVFVSFINPKAY